MRHLEPGAQPLGLCVDEAEEGLLIPIDKVLLWRFAFDGLLTILSRFFVELDVLDGVLRRLRNHPATIIETFASGTTGDLMKVARAQNPGLLAVELGEPGE